MFSFVQNLPTCYLFSGQSNKYSTNYANYASNATIVLDSISSLDD